jgi:hypothetical protein
MFQEHLLQIIIAMAMNLHNGPWPFSPHNANINKIIYTENSTDNEFCPKKKTKKAAAKLIFLCFWEDK